MCELHKALERQLGLLPVMTHDNGYPVQALPKADLLSLLALHPETACMSISEETDRQYHVNGDEADEVWVDKP